MERELQEIYVERTERHMTAKPGQLCSYCRGQMAEESIGNPTWPWKFIQGRGISVFCSRNCMEWKRYHMKLTAFRNSKKSQPKGRIKLTETEFLDNLQRAGEIPTGIDPLADPDENMVKTPQEEPKQEPVNDAPKAEEAVTEPVQAETEPIKEEKKMNNRLKRIVREIELEGEHIKASVTEFRGKYIMEIDELETEVSKDMIQELLELADALDHLLEVPAL